jgi:hypothetical protein
LSETQDENHIVIMGGLLARAFMIEDYPYIPAKTHTRAHTNSTPPLFSCLTCTISTHFLSLSEMMLNLLGVLWPLVSPLRYEIYLTSTT